MEQSIYEKLFSSKSCPWIIETLIRDGYKCVDCPSKEFLIVHHLDNSRKTGNLNNHLTNLVTVCRTCHAKRHGLTSNKEDVLELRHSGLTYEEIGKILGITKQRVHQLYKKHAL